MTFTIMTISKTTLTIDNQHNYKKATFSMIVHSTDSECHFPVWHLRSVSTVLSDIMLGIVMLSAIHVGYHE